MEDLLQALDLGRASIALGLAITRQLPQLTDRQWRHEARTNHPVRRHVSQPPGIGEIGLATRNLFTFRALHSHTVNLDSSILVSSIAAMVAGAISAIASILQFSLLFGGSDEEDSPLGLIGTLATIILAPIAAMLLQLAVSRQREYVADATGAQLLGRVAPLADALETLEHGAQAIPISVNPATASLYAVNPLRRLGIATWFMTHPPLAERIRRLRALDGDRVVALGA